MFGFLKTKVHRTRHYVSVMAFAVVLVLLACLAWLDESPLRHAPHTIEDVVGEWDRPYSREQAIYPLESLRNRMYYPPVSRIDSAYGDRNLMCSCEPLSHFAS